MGLFLLEAINMLRIIKLLLTGDYHLHQWETQYKVQSFDGNDLVGFRVYCRCKHCGKYKTFDL